MSPKIMGSFSFKKNNQQADLYLSGQNTTFGKVLFFKFQFRGEVKYFNIAN